MERNDRSALATFYAEAPLLAGDTVRLRESAAHHAQVRRLRAGDGLWLTDGVGTRAKAELISLGRSELEARILDREFVARPRAIHLHPPVADRDRMLWLAEKATELGVASWQAVRFHRSASVSPRGEGPAFAAKVRPRMIAALEQSGGAWLPELRDDMEPSRLEVPAGAVGIVLERCGAPIMTELAGTGSELAIVLGPEGGMETDELELLAARGWRSVRLATTTLRFETAAVAAVAIARAATLTEGA